MLKMLLVAGHQIVGRCGLDTSRRAHTVTAQELQQLRHLAPLATPGLGANALVSTTTAVLVALDMHLAEISQTPPGASRANGRMPVRAVP